MERGTLRVSRVGTDYITCILLLMVDAAGGGQWTRWILKSSKRTLVYVSILILAISSPEELRLFMHYLYLLVCLACSSFPFDSLDLLQGTLQTFPSFQKLP